MRGQQAITSNFPSAIEAKPDQKGHRNVHQDRRDDALAARFYYHFHIRRLRYDDCLLEIEKEFFITTLYIAQRLTDRADYMKKLVKMDAKVTDLKRLFPFYAWN